MSDEPPAQTTVDAEKRLYLITEQRDLVAQIKELNTQLTGRPALPVDVYHQTKAQRNTIASRLEAIDLELTAIKSRAAQLSTAHAKQIQSIKHDMGVLVGSVLDIINNLTTLSQSKHSTADEARAYKVISTQLTNALHRSCATEPANAASVTP